MKKKRIIREVSINEILANMLIAVVSTLTGVRGVEWIITGADHLERVSPLYSKMQTLASIQTFGWFLLLSAVIMFASIFMKSRLIYLLWFISGILGAVTHFLFAMASVEGANLFTTYYNALILASVQIILALIGVIALWKTRIK